MAGAISNSDTSEPAHAAGLVQLNDLSGKRVRLNPAFRLVAHQALPPKQRQTLATVASCKEHFGVLIPKVESSLGILAIDKDTAHMLLSVTEPSHLPMEHLNAGSRASHNQSIARLVVDGVLQIEDQNQFVYGPAAHDVVFVSPSRLPVSTHTLARLSYDTVRAAQTLSFKEPARMAAWLYAANSTPLRSRWSRQFGNAASIGDSLGIGTGQPLARQLDAYYHCSQGTAWTSWQARDPSNTDSLPLEPNGPHYKLYVSIPPASLAEAFAAVACCVMEEGVPAFKLGNDAHGLLRPDKLMLYFSDAEALCRTAANLKRKLAGCPAQGVPFTEPLDADGLLSRGIDPPTSQLLPGWPGGESWRAWVVNRLARALQRSRSLVQEDQASWLYALDVLRLDGVDTESWGAAPFT